MRNKLRIVCFGISLTGLLSLLISVHAAPGDLDLTFSQDGKLYDFLAPGGEDIINGSALQADGKLVAVGTFLFGSVRSCAATRFNTDGTLDATFDGDGKAVFPSGKECVLSAVAIQADGKIVAAGRIITTNYPDFLVFRYNPDGSLDNTFDLDGIVITSFGNGYDEGHAVAIQPDGKIVVAGVGSELQQGDISLARYNTNGSLDTSFDSDGKATAPGGFGGGQVYAVALQADGKIVTGGVQSPNMSLARHNANGSIDTSFDGDGQVGIQIGYGGGRVHAIAIQPDGKIVAAGSTSVVTGPGFPPPQKREFAVARINSDGSLDTSFDLDGKVTIALSAFHDEANALAIQTDGKMVLAGSISNSNGVTETALARLNTDGSLDTSFNSTGKVVVPFSPSHDEARALSIQPDGRIVAAGLAVFCCGAQENFAAHRFNANGSLDSSFGSGGTTTHDVGFKQSSGRAIAMQPNGKFVVAGFTEGLGAYDFAAIRYNADGSADTSFDTDGKVSTSLRFDDDARAVAIQSDGKVILAGNSTLGFNQPGHTVDAALVRYNTNGSLDTTFDMDGKLLIDNGGYDAANAMAIQPDGRILIAGYVQPFGGDFSILLSRLNPDGSPDTSFDTDGTVIVAGLTWDQARAIALQPDGKIVVVGEANNGSNFDIAVLRFNADGSPDNTFDFDGQVTTPINTDDFGKAVTIQPDGKIVVAGFSNTGAISTNVFAVVRYNPNGSLDSSFDLDGRTTTDILTGPDAANAVALQPNGKIVAGGTSIHNISPNFFNINEFAVVRYNVDGSLDTTYDSDGKLVLDFWGISDDRLYAMALDRNGRAVVVGEASSNIAIARVLGDFVPNAKARFDFDGDGRSDVSVYRPSSGVWYQLFSSGVAFGSPTFGITGDIPVPADFDGDGKTDLAVFRPSSGVWWYRASTDGTVRAATWGVTGDIPLPADIDNDGYDDFVVFRPSNNTWYRSTVTGAADQKEFGLAGDRPLIGDFDGDGRADQAIFRPSTGDWWYSASSAGGAFRTVHWGQNGDIPVPADYDGDGRTDYGVFRPSDGGWYIYNSGNGSFTILAFGTNGDRAAPADYDGDGRADIAVFRPSTGVWHILQSTSGATGYRWGISTDVAIPNAFAQP